MRVLVVQHLDIEPPALIGEVLEDAGCTLEIVHAGRGEPLPESSDGIAAAVIMGGPQSANDTHLDHIRAEKDWLGRAIAADLPMLGVCLGAQLIARAAGASVMPSPVRELGWYHLRPEEAAISDPLFSLLPKDGLDVFQWHGETFTLPEGATLLASCEAVPNQAFRLDGRTYGLQFHVEVDESIIRQWVEAGDSERAHLGKQGVARMLAGTPSRLPPMRSFCRAMTRAWLELIRA